MAGGGGRPRSPPGGLLGMAAVVVAGLGALTGVRGVPKEEQHSVDLIEKRYVYGDTKHEVNVYVKVFTNSPFLVCMDLARSQEEVIDPKYLWVGPDGKNLEGRMYVNLTETGKLMVMGFKESMSGAYTCTLAHKIIETTTQEEREMFEAYKFMVYAYREADHAYQVFVRFTTKECELAANSQFFEELKKILNNIISDLTCHIIESSYKCHSVKIPKQGLLHELFVSFQVNPFAPGWEEVCHQVPYDCEDETNMRVQEARDRIGEFFNKQMYALKHESQTVPAIRYVDNSFSVTHIDSCRPGFGKNDITHKNCASCCVVCDPGTYSPNNEVTCQICTRPRVKTYGARSC
ncbi:zona pellucida-binding protein 2 isoform X1 [Ciconia boyciana]|uniref:zona pellucida-binding protein 2 isoform X1 n=1 Tax=Ciconia boyciana TaxID=52775 RepID=UPI003B9EA52D